MAKIKFGMMMTDARGKLGGQVFSKNRSGAYVRTKVTPVNPQTAKQQANRSLLGSLSSGWSGLSQAQRNGWNSAVESWQKTNVFGDLQKPTGKNLFTGLNKVMFQNFPDADLMLLPPVKEEFNVFSIASASYNSSTLAFTVLLTDGATENSTFQVRVTGALSAGTSYFTNQLRGLSPAVVLEEGGILNIGPSYLSQMGTVASGQKIGVEIREVRENGQLGVPVTTSVISI